MDNKRELVQEINNAYSEVYDIIYHMDNEIKYRIPISFVKMIKENRNINYKVNIDYNKNINEQKILYTTKVILGLIYRDFLVDEEEKEILIKKEKEDISKKDIKENKVIKEESKALMIVEEKKKSILENILLKIKTLLFK